jgi:sRNA-binding regulator protein Hfq
MRKLIRPTREELEKLKKQYTHSSVVAKLRTPPDATGDEANYLRQHSDHRTPMIVKLLNGEEVRGWIEYYDLHFVRLTVERGPNRFVYKKDILYLHEDLEAMRRRKSLYR